MLAQTGVGFECTLPGFEDDHLLRGGVSAEEWVAALACLKATAAYHRLKAAGQAAPFAVLGADTVVAKGGKLIGKAHTQEQARAILRELDNCEHDVLTGVALVGTEGRKVFVDRARVRVGEVGEARIEEYVATGRWKGKAGAYNLSEQREAGWPIHTDGDPDTVMGLPMRRLRPLLGSFAPAGAGHSGSGTATC